VCSASPADTWSQGLAALRSHDSARAIDLFTSFLRETEGAGDSSPEAHHNLALALWEKGDHGAAVFHFLRAATLTGSPWQALRSLELLDGIQRELGIHDGVTDHTFFQIFLLGTPSLALVIFCIGFWSFLTLILWHWYHWPGFHAKSLFAIPVVLLLLSFSLRYSHDHLFQYGVLGNGDEVPLYRAAGDPVEKKLADLPAGTIVTWGKSEHGFIEISYPVVGWVPEKALLRN
jgi:hypothetical protein